jgi:hypothetical protein
MFAVLLLLAVSLIACEVDTGGRESMDDLPSSGGWASTDDLPSYGITMYQGQEEIGGEMVSLEQVQDNSPLILYYFDAQCKKCLDGLRVLQSFYAENKDGPTVLAVYLGLLTGNGDDEDAKRLLAEAGVTFPAGFTTDSFVINTHAVGPMPNTLFYNKSNGNFHASGVQGRLLESDLSEMIKEIAD